MFSGKALVQFPQRDPNSSLDATILLLGQILGQSIKKSKQGVAVPDGGHADIIRAFLSASGHPVSPVTGQVPATACQNGTCGVAGPHTKP